ncbi:MAG: hypothetical protein HDQ99_09590 [Lachnospiraceae bacterium]|nr:hypothetical protein [Lachnospiraceae bacterium]
MKIAILDSGFDFETKLQNSIVYSKNFTGEDDKDQNGHGTCIVKLIDDLRTDLHLYIMKVLNKKKSGKLSFLKKALAEALIHDVDIINVSLGLEMDIKDCELNELINKCKCRGIIIITAESNNGEINYLSEKYSIISVQGKTIIEGNKENIFYMNNFPRILPWLSTTYILSGANSFLTPFIIKKVCEIIEQQNTDKIRRIDTIRDYIRQSGQLINIIDKGRERTHNKVLMEMLEKEDVIQNLYSQERKLTFTELTPNNITQLVRVIEQVTSRNYIYDSFWLPDLMYLENFVNKIEKIVNMSIQ